MSCFTIGLLFLFGPLLVRIFLSLFADLLGPILGEKAGGANFGATREQALRNYLSVLMPLLAKIAKSDGRVNEDEISSVEKILRQLNLSDEMRRYAQHCFIRAKDSSIPFEQYAIQFAETVPNFEIRLMTFQFMVAVACADNHVSDQERRLLLNAARIFELPPQLVQQIFAQIFGDRGGRQQRSEQRTSSRQHSRAADLQLLGLGANATADEIKRAYRQKVKELHPDRLQAQGLPEAMLKQATERMAEINAAYERLKRPSSY